MFPTCAERADAKPAANNLAANGLLKKIISCLLLLQKKAGLRLFKQIHHWFNTGQQTGFRILHREWLLLTLKLFSHICTCNVGKMVFYSKTQDSSFTHNHTSSFFYPTFTHIQALMNTSQSNLRFSFLPGDTLARRLEQPGNEPPWADDSLFLLRCGQAQIRIRTCFQFVQQEIFIISSEKRCVVSNLATS